MNAVGSILFVINAQPIAYSHGVAVLSAILKQNNFDVQVFVSECNLAEFETVLASNNFDFVCFSHCIKKEFDSSIPYIDSALSLQQRVLLGGTYHRRNNPNKYDGVVPICRGDGEQLANYFLTGDTAIFDSRQIQKNLDDLPLADYDLFEHLPYDGHIKDFRKCYKLPYTVSRGCIGECNFCEVQHQYKSPRIRFSSVEDFKYLKHKYNPDLFFFTDELFPYYNDAYLELFSSKFRHPFFAFIRADIPGDRLQTLIDSGMEGCAFGVESGDEHYRNVVLNKQVTDDDIYRTVDVLKRNNTYFAHFYMVGTKGETFKQRLKTDQMVSSLGGVPMVFEYTNVMYNTRGC